MCHSTGICGEAKNLLYKRELLFKYVVIGEFGVGKTSIIKRYAEETFSTTYKTTIGADFAIKTIDWDDNTVINLHLWDIAGHERFGSLTSVYYRYALAAAVVFDLTRPETFKSVEKWIFDLRKRISLPNGNQIPVILLANKGDIRTDSIPMDIELFCKSNNILTWLITSAKENVNLDAAMNILIDITLNSYNFQKAVDTDSVVLKKNDATVKKKWFCFF